MARKQPKRKPRPGMDEYGRTPLWRAASSGDVVAVRRELKKADPSAGDDDGFTPLHIAA